MNNEIKKYCEHCKFYSILGCQSTLICKDGNKFLVEDVQPVNRWISAEDKLPEAGQRVLVVQKSNQTVYAAKYSAYMHFIVSFEHWIDAMNASYWQPLPEPPEV